MGTETIIAFAGLIIAAATAIELWRRNRRWRRVCAETTNLIGAIRFLNDAPAVFALFAVNEKKRLYGNAPFKLLFGENLADWETLFTTADLATVKYELEGGNVVTDHRLSLQTLAGEETFTVNIEKADFQDQPALVIWAIRDASQISAVYYNAYHDALTDVLNRRGFEERLVAELHRAKRVTDYTFSLAIIDIDKFKMINDTYGHGCGDALLQDITALLRSTVRMYDIICRWGGDEFVLLLPSISESQVYDLAERLRRAVEQKTFKWNGNEMQVTISMGLQSYVTGMTAEEIIEMADRRLYQAKNSGRNRVTRSPAASGAPTTPIRKPITMAPPAPNSDSPTK